MHRERHILQRIEVALNEVDRVMIVFGGGHLVKERDALKELLGDPANRKDYSLLSGSERSVKTRKA